MNPVEAARSNLILFVVFLIPVVWAALLIAPSLSGGLPQILVNLTAAMNHPFDIQWVENTPKCILIFVAAYGMGIGIYLSTKLNYRRREEHGSARWGIATAVNKKYRDKDLQKNKILTQNVRIGLDGRRHKRNLNVLVVGGSGSGKTRFYAKPNVMQANTSFVVLDPKGEILRDTGNLLKGKGYEIKVLDLINMHLSHCYNPFAYLKDDKDVKWLPFQRGQDPSGVYQQTAADAATTFQLRLNRWE
ncbi:MAG: TRAG family protein [Firmicutes bacterium HGW-Firmicutes-12]|nr:MAG: TRAG family protein [Firmicutes bacterium HGW-Firmicutes-12]